MLVHLDEQVDPDTVASDSFMVNIQSVLYRFAEPFMDASYTKVCVDASSVLGTQIMPFSDRSNWSSIFRALWPYRCHGGNSYKSYCTGSFPVGWRKSSLWRSVNSYIAVIILVNFLSCRQSGPAPNFISDIFYLAVATSHYGYQKTISSYIELDKHMEDIERHLSFLNGDGSWMGVSYSRSMIRLQMLTTCVDSITSPYTGIYQQYQCKSLTFFWLHPIFISCYRTRKQKFKALSMHMKRNSKILSLFSGLSVSLSSCRCGWFGRPTQRKLIPTHLLSSFPLPPVWSLPTDPTPDCHCQKMCQCLSGSFPNTLSKISLTTFILQHGEWERSRWPAMNGGDLFY